MVETRWGFVEDEVHKDSNGVKSLAYWAWDFDH